MNVYQLLTALMAALAAFSALFLIVKSRQQNPQEQEQRLVARLDQVLRDENTRLREELARSARDSRDELGKGLSSQADAISKGLKDGMSLHKEQLDSFAKQLHSLTQGNLQRLDALRETLETKIKSLQDDNAVQLEKMRVTVDEKLQATLEQRLGESFRQVSERLELVHKGLGEMQVLASGVGDLKKVLSNVKTRGIMGEMQLGALLEQMLTPQQYESNVVTKRGSRDRVEFAVKLPGRDNNANEPVLLPIDAKFPQEDYQRLIDAQERGDAEGVTQAANQLEQRIRLEARSIRDKYIDTPHTTEFGLLFLPTEGLYAEVLRRPGLWEQLQRDEKVIITGPTTLAALLNSLQMGFRTLAIEKRSGEVWNLLGTVKTEFSKFGVMLDKTKKKLEEASNTIDEASRKTRTIERRLRDVQDTPESLPRTAVGAELLPLQFEKGDE